MGYAEARDVIRGLELKERAKWEQTRCLMELVHKVATGKDLNFPFPWEEKTKEDREKEAEAIDELRRRAKAVEEYLNRRNGEHGNNKSNSGH